MNMLSRYNKNKMSEEKWIKRLINLESLSGVAGMVGGMVRHLKCVCNLEVDNGWINEELKESENERMHLFMLMELKEIKKINRF
jgi:hypothetical protein